MEKNSYTFGHQDNSSFKNYSQNMDSQINEIHESDQCHEFHLFKGTTSNPEYTTYHSLPKSNDKSIREELMALKLPDDIIDTSEKIYKKMQIGTRRANKRKQMIFHCVRTAYNYHKIPKDPKDLADICGINYSEITKASSICSPIQTNFQTPIVFYTPTDFISDIFTRLQKFLESDIEFSDETCDYIIEISKAVIEEDPDLLDEKPQMVAAAIVLYYLESHGIKIDRKRYAALFKSSDMTINKLKKQVEIAYNN